MLVAACPVPGNATCSAEARATDQTWLCTVEAGWEAMDGCVSALL